MISRLRMLVFGALVITIMIAQFGNSKAKNMSEITFNLGRNIVETAKGSGVPKFTVRNVSGLVSYSVNDLPPDVIVTFSRPTLEASFTSVFAATMYADEDHKNNLIATDIVLQFSTDQVRAHNTGQEFITGIISKFTNKKWARHIPDICPAVTGRSTYTQADGTIGQFEACPLDPLHPINPTDWRTLAGTGLSYEWVGNGVIATLRVDSSEDNRGITYRATLEYVDQIIKSKRQAKNLSEKLAEGDKKGWNSTFKHTENVKRLAEEVRGAEVAAVKRGDKLVMRVAE